MVNWKCLNDDCGWHFLAPAVPNYPLPKTPWQWCPRCHASARRCDGQLNPSEAAMTRTERDLLLRVSCATIVMMEKLGLDPTQVRETNKAVFDEACAKGEPPTRASAA